MDASQGIDRFRDWLLRFLREYVESLAIGFAIALLLKFFVFSSYRVTQEAMIPSLQPGDLVVTYDLPYLQKNGYLPARGTVVIFACPQQPKVKCVKRLVGWPGDRIEIIEGALYVNGEVVDRNVSSDVAYDFESFNEKEFLIKRITNEPMKELKAVIIPPDTFYVLSDDRNDGRDSRFYGPVPIADLRGEVRLVWASVDPKNNEFRFERIFKLVH